MTEVITKILRELTPEDIEKLKLLSQIFGGTQIQQPIQNVTVEQGFAGYNKIIEFKLSKKSVECAKTSERRFLMFIPGNRILNSIERKDAEDLMMQISKTARKACHNYLKIYRTMFNIFIDWNYIDQNPFLKVKLPKRQKEEPIFFNEEQLQSLYSKLIEKGKDTIADLVIFGVSSGMRPGEMRLLKWSDIDFRNKVITVGKSFSTKTKRIRKLPFNEKMEEILFRNSNRQLAKRKILCEYVFTKENGMPYQLDTISKTVKRAIRDAGLPEEFHLYCTRATAATRWASNKVPIFTVSKLLGHTNPSITARYYANVDLEELRDAINRL